jgi:hypothetical protein
MYWPLGSARRIRNDHLNPEDPILALRINRRTNLFVTLTASSVTLWNPEVSFFLLSRVRSCTNETFMEPTCRIAKVERTTESRAVYGENKSVEWSSDGHSVFISVRTLLHASPGPS